MWPGYTRQNLHRFCTGFLIYCFATYVYAAPQLDYSVYQHAMPRFTVELPTHWVSEENEQSLVFSGESGTEQWQTTINFQLVEGENQKLSSHVEDMKHQWKAIDPAYRLLSEQSGTLSGMPAISLRARYRDKTGQTEVLQEQLLIRYPERVFFIAYTAPGSLYETYYPVMQRVLETFKVGRVATETVPDKQADEKASRVQLLVEAVQQFREQNAVDGISGWRNYADPELGEYIALLGEDIWPEAHVAGGWAYFFALSMPNIGRLMSEVPVVAYYHPWSDVWLITEWAIVPEPRLITADIILGEWLRNRGHQPFDVEPDWLRGDDFRPAALARSVVNNHRALDALVHNETPWRDALQIEDKQPLFDEINTPTVSAELMASWSRAIEATRARPDSPKIKDLLDEADSFLSAGIAGQIIQKLRPADNTDPQTIASIKAMSPDMFSSMNAVYWTADKHAATLYLVPGMNSDFCLTLRYRRDAWGLNLKRVDLLYFPLILETYREKGWP